MNKVILVGNVVKDPESRSTQDGKKVVNFSLAINEKYQGKDNASFFSCVAWAKLAEIIETYVTKGTKIAIVGKLQNRSWDKSDGTKAYSTDILILELELLKKANDEISIDDIDL